MRKKLETLSNTGDNLPEKPITKVDQQTESVAQQNVSPGLARLRMTPGKMGIE